MNLRKSLLLLVPISLVICYCNSLQSTKIEEFAEGTQEGFELAKYHCSGCHEFVAAATLDKKTWEASVLPDMAQRLGIKVMWGKEYVDQGGNGALLAFKDWKKIVDYYSKTAPDTLDVSALRPQIRTDSSSFIVKIPRTQYSNVARTVMTIFDTATDNIYTGDGFTNRMYKWNKDLTVIDSVNLFSPPVNAWFYSDRLHDRQLVVTTLGSMKAVNVANGRILRLNIEGKLTSAFDTIASELPRPVQTIPADLNGDSLTDWVSCGFGNISGGLLWFRKLPEKGYSKEVIVNSPGATQVEILDYNKDGRQDIMVLMAHEKESIRLYLNNGDDTFTEKTLLHFPPVQGSTSFQLVDFNKDGLDDILYTCGDNADISQVFKPFHGIYIFINKGNGSYQQQFFLHINGCTKAVARDFDNDGDLDIASIAFYADHRNNPQESFIYLRQEKSWSFSALSPSVHLQGRWLTMDVADFDKDGDEDIILGNFAKDLLIDKTYKPEWNQSQPFIILENTAN